MDLQSVLEAMYQTAAVAKAAAEQQIACKEDVNKVRSELLRKLRVQLEPFVYNYLIQTYGRQLDDFWQKHSFPKKAEHAWVLVERRIHPNFWFVLRNLAWAGPNMSLYIFCSDYNISFLKELLGAKAEQVHLIPVFKGEGAFQEATDDYQVIFKKAEFYKMIDAEYMLKIELDCFLRRAIPPEIFVGDFYGAPWIWAPEKAGGGGLNVRRVAALAELCEKLRDYNTVPEDGWLGAKLTELGYVIPPLELRRHVFSENYPVHNPVGVHQFWTFLLHFNLDNKEQFKMDVGHYLTLAL